MRQIRPNARLTEHLLLQRLAVFGPSLVPPRHLLAAHVRRGDKMKVGEAVFLPLETYVHAAWVLRERRLPDARHVLLSTEDPRVLRAARRHFAQGHWRHALTAESAPQHAHRCVRPILLVAVANTVSWFPNQKKVGNTILQCWQVF